MYLRSIWRNAATVAVVSSVLVLPPIVSAHAQTAARIRPEAVGMSSARLGQLPRVLQDYVERGEVAGALVLVLRDGKLVALDSAGYADVAAHRPIGSGSIVRMMSMTKPITAVAAMILYEEGKILLSDPVSKYIPSFANMRVLVRDSSAEPKTTFVPARRQITVKDLMTHRSGITYGFNVGAVAELYRNSGVQDGLATSDITLEENVNRIAAQPLVNQPGSAYEYSLGMDVLGRVVEIVSGTSLDRFMKQRIFDPLAMKDTYFAVPDAKTSRIALLYTVAADQSLRPVQPFETFGRIRVSGLGSRGSAYLSGGAGLYSTAGDYSRFLLMMMNRGELDGVRILSPKTVQFMTMNHTADLGPGSAGVGRGYGLGVTVTFDPTVLGMPESQGTFGHGGAFATSGWVDPAERMVAVLITQRIPTTGLKLREAVTSVIYSSITGPTVAPSRATKVLLAPTN